MGDANESTETVRADLTCDSCTGDGCPGCCGTGAVEPACNVCGYSHDTADHIDLCAYCDAPSVTTTGERECEECHAETLSARRREQRAEDWASWGDAMRDQQKDAR